jgi:lysophospholipid acyltransferase (LPLAT)-like uncharacterized protein
MPFRDSAAQRDPEASEAAADWRIRFIAAAGACFLRVLRRTVRLRFHDDATVRDWERGRQPFLLAFWHRHLLLMRYAYRGRRMNVLVSRSRDGELIARVLAHLGISTVRGSSSRGGAVGLRELLRAARSGSDIAITPDGPRGPLREVQPGVVLAAAASGLPLVPVAMAATRRAELYTWDRMPVPLPGSRVEVVYGEPLRVPRDARPEEWAPRIGAALDAVERRAEEIAGHGGEPCEA